VRDIRFLSGIRRAVRQSTFDRRLLATGRHIGKNILDATGGYEDLVLGRISLSSLPRISLYSNGNFKTNIYRVSDPSPCLDEIFYKYEDLVPYGKEYWFAIFTGTEGKKPMQLISCFGRRNSRKWAIDDVEVNGTNPGDGVLKTAAFAWCYDGRRKLVVPTVEAETTVADKSIMASGRGLNIGVSGTVPAYNVKIDSGPIKCDFNLKKPAFGFDEEVLNEHKMGLNYQVYNLYYDFDGTLNGKAQKGRCYLQKVILSTPLVPWHWARLVFHDGSFFVFFKPYFGGRELNYQLRNKGLFYSARHDRLFEVSNLDVYHDRRRLNWKIVSKGEDYSLNMAIRAYAGHGFSFRHGGAFNYDEYMAIVKRFNFESDGIRLDIKALGGGAGIVEDATGILI
jgi:hypothetical protein